MDEQVKDPTTIDEQIHILSERGMQVDAGLKDKKSWSEPDLSALRCEKVWFKVVGGQL